VFYGAVGEVSKDGGGYEGKVDASITVWRDGNLECHYRTRAGGLLCVCLP